MLFHKSKRFEVILLSLFCTILMASTATYSAQQSNVSTRILIISRIIPKSTGTEMKAYSDWLETKVLDQMLNNYPCAETITESGLAAILQNNKQRELLGSDTTEDMAALAGALGYKYIISLTVTPIGSGQVSFNAKIMDPAKAKIHASISKTSNRGDDAVDAIEELAKQFGNSLNKISRLSKDKCEPTNPWAGYVSYEYEKSKETISDSYAVFGKAKDTITTSDSHHITVQIGWNEEPKATFNIRETHKSHIAGKYTMNCKKGRKSGTWDIKTEAVSTAKEKVSATVSVSGPDAKGKYSIGVNIPTKIKGSQHLTKTNRDDGGCGKPVNTTEGPFDLIWTYEFYFPGIDGNTTDPNTLSGSITDSPYKGAKISWSLKRTPMRK
jgi:hypothetical protein